MFSTFLAISIPSVLALWPLPQHLTTGSTALRLSPTFAIKVAVPDAPQDLTDAVSRTKSFLHNDKLERLVIGRGASDANTIKTAKFLNTLTISLSTPAVKGKVASISEEAIVDIDSRVEGYTLTIPGDGSGATLKANSTLGLFRGLTTFSQLWYYWDGTVYSLEAPIHIEDAPAYVRAPFQNSISMRPDFRA